MAELGGQLAREELQRHDRDERLEQHRHLRQRDQHVGVGLDGRVALLGQAERASAAGAHLLDAADHLVVELVATARGHDAQDRQALLDQGDRAVLELAGREALGVEVGDLLELERSLERDRVAGVATEEQHRAAADVVAGQAVDLLGLVEHGLDVGRHLVELVHDLRDLVAVAGALDLREVEREEVAGDQLGQEALGRGDPDLRAGVGVDDAVGLARDRRAVGVADRQHLRALLAGVADRLQGVGGLAGLADRDDQRGRGEDRVAVAELAGELDLDRDPAPVLDGVLRDHAGVEGRAGRDDDDLVDVAQVLVGQPHLVELQQPVGAAAAEQRVGHGARLLEDLLAHEPVVAVLLGGREVPVDVVAAALGGRAVEARDARRRHG